MVVIDGIQRALQGCSYLFIPSLFPQITSTSPGAGQTETANVSGIGSGGKIVISPVSNYYSSHV